MKSPVIIGENRLTLAQVVAVARNFAQVKLASVARKRVSLCRQIIVAMQENNVKVYGVTTGFASHRDRYIDPQESSRLSHNLLKSHSCAVGDPYPEDIVRAAILVRAHALALGNSGIRPVIIDRFISMLNERVYPYVPQQGSCGSSGDLAPLSHLALVLIGDPYARVHRRILGEEKRSSDAFQDHAAGRHAESDYFACARAEDFVALDEKVRRRLPFAPLELAAKEGLACNNGAVFSAVITALGLWDFQRLLTSADLIAALSHEAVQAVPDSLDSGIVQCRPHPGHITSAASLRAALHGSDLVPASGACGFNMAHYNQTLIGLQRILTLQEWPAPARSQVEELRQTMQAFQTGVWKKIAGQRQQHRDGCYRDNELQACAAALQPIICQWEELLGWRIPERQVTELPALLRKELTSLYYQHLVQVVRSDLGPDVQDNYSFRATATVHGAARDAIAASITTIEIEINSATDNPLILFDNLLQHYCRQAGITPEQAIESEPDFCRWLNDNWREAANHIKSGANFHGEPVGCVADHLAAAVTEIGNISERRIAMLIDHHHSKGLGSCLSWKPGLNSGFLIPQYSAASLMTENKILANPASVDSIPTGESCEDYVSMSTTAARKLAQILGNVERIIAVEMLGAYQGVQFRKPAQLGRYSSRLENLIATRLGDLILELSDWKSANQTRQQGQAKMHEDFAALGLADCMVQAMAPCLLDDITFYPLLEAASHLIRIGLVSEISSTAEANSSHNQGK